MPKSCDLLIINRHRNLLKRIFELKKREKSEREKNSILDIEEKQINYQKKRVF